MTREQARELFSAAYDEQLDVDEAAAFERLLQSDAELAREYHLFRDTLAAVQQPLAADVAAPDLLRGVQRRLRSASGGRFYGDRFAERMGAGRIQPGTLLIVLVAAIVLLWIASYLLRSVSLTG